MADVTRKIKFLLQYEVKDHQAGTNSATIYKKGQVRRMNERSAAHFISRGVAVYTDEK